MKTRVTLPDVDNMRPTERMEWLHGKLREVLSNRSNIISKTKLYLSPERDILLIEVCDADRHFLSERSVKKIDKWTRFCKCGWHISANGEGRLYMAIMQK